MHAKLLRYYNQELMHIRESADEFAKAHEKVARRLSLSDASVGAECPDPYVERLLEGFAFLTARVQVRQDAEYARFTQHLLELVYPGFLAPTPAMMIAQLQPDMGDAGLALGPVVPRHSPMDSRLRPGERTPCTFRTASDLRLWPLEITQARYQAHVTDLSAAALAGQTRARACLRVRFKVTAALVASQLQLDTLTLHLTGHEEVAYRVYEQLFARCVGVAVAQVGKGPSVHVANLPADALEPGGLREDEALLPQVGSGLSGYRLLKEYAAMPARFLFAHLNGLRKCLAQIKGDEFELLFLMDRPDGVLEKTLDVGNFMLHCVPAVNLFPKRVDMVELRPGRHEHPLVADAAQKMNFEIHSVTAVKRLDEGGDSQARPVESLYNRHDGDAAGGHAYYTVHRIPHFLSEDQRARARTGYVGTELLLSLVDRHENPLSGPMGRLSVETLCSNRDLPITLALGSWDDFRFKDSYPVQVRCVKNPTRPTAPEVDGRVPWDLLSHLQLNYLSLVDGTANPGSSGQGAAALRDMLALYGVNELSPLHNQVKGLVAVSSQAAICRIPIPGPIAFGRGVQVTLTLDEQVFEGSNILVLGTVLERFLARHATLNSFVQLALHSQSRGEVKKWKPRIGLRPIV